MSTCNGGGTKIMRAEKKNAQKSEGVGKKIAQNRKGWEKKCWNVKVSNLKLIGDGWRGTTIT